MEHTMCGSVIIQLVVLWYDFGVYLSGGSCRIVCIFVLVVRAMVESLQCSLNTFTESFCYLPVLCGLVQREALGS